MVRRGLTKALPFAGAAALVSGVVGCSSGAPVSFGEGDPAEVEVAEQLSLGYLDEAMGADGVDARRDFTVKRVFVDELSVAHTHVQQRVGGVPVFGGEAIVHLGRDGSLFALTDARVRGIPPDFDVTPAISADEAIRRVVGGYDCAECLTAPPAADLWVLRAPRDGLPHLAYRVELRREDGTDRTEMPVVFVDARTGEEVLRYDNLQTGKGKSLYSGTVRIGTTAHGGVYYMEDVSRKIGTFDSNNGSSTSNRFTDADDLWSAGVQRAGVDAHYAVTMARSYYKFVHGRDGIDGSGGPGWLRSVDGQTKLITSRVHYGTKYNNAFWNGNLMTFGDGDGDRFTPLVTLDVGGHELTHGVTQWTAALAYFGEPGALNESMSDVFGAMIERYAKGESAGTWKIGEQCYTKAIQGDALRYMDNPHAASNKGFTADDDPDHYSERYTGTADNGGVHINSGIPNMAFYLLAKGGSHHLGGSMVGIGADDAARIWYKALTAYMTSSTTFAGARAATLGAAEELFGDGSPQRNAVASAWALVGVL
jgi:thermolysin